MRVLKKNLMLVEGRQKARQNNVKCKLKGLKRLM